MAIKGNLLGRRANYVADAVISHTRDQEAVSSNDADKLVLSILWVSFGGIWCI